MADKFPPPQEAAEKFLQADQASQQDQQEADDSQAAQHAETEKQDNQESNTRPIQVPTVDPAIEPQVFPPL